MLSGLCALTTCHPRQGLKVIFEFVIVCVCVCEREREREREACVCFHADTDVYAEQKRVV